MLDEDVLVGSELRAFQWSCSRDQRGAEAWPPESPRLFLPDQADGAGFPGMPACLPGNSCSDAVSWRRSRPGQSLLVMKRPHWSWETAARPVAACWPCSEAWLQPSITDAGDCSRSKLLFVPPHANASIAAASLPLLQAGPHGLQIIPLDFNQTCLKTLPPQCGQCFQASTRGINTLDCVYLEGNLLPHQGLSNISHC